MDRRLIGALLVVTVAATAAVIPALNGRRIVGVGQTIELPLDPRVGECVFDRSANAPDANGMLTPAPATFVRATSTAQPITVVHVAGCTGAPALGEIVDVATAAHPPASGPRVSIPEMDCRSSALEYAGLVSVDGRFQLVDQRADDPVRWDISINTGNRWVLPTRWLVAAGRTWRACVASPYAGREYTGRVAGAYAGRSLPAAFGTCWNARRVSAGAEMLDCNRRHLAELISSGRVTDISTVTFEQITSSCEALAAKVMRRADPTNGGELVVKTSPEQVTTVNRPIRSVSVLCYISSADRDLNGTLVGLGERPIPFAD